MQQCPSLAHCLPVVGCFQQCHATCACACAWQVKKPFVPKKRTFQFPAVERMGQVAVKVDNLTHG